MMQLREMLEQDREMLLRWRNLPQVSDHMYSDHTITEEEHERWFASVREDSSRRYWIIMLDDEPVGLVNLVDINDEARRCHWAFYLSSDATRGRGVGSWVEYQVLKIVFDVLGLNKLCAEVLVSNAAVISMHEGFGFRREATYREHVWRNGLPVDVVGLGMLRSDWELCRPAIEARLRRKGLLDDGSEIA